MHQISDMEVSKIVKEDRESIIIFHSKASNNTIQITKLKKKKKKRKKRKVLFPLYTKKKILMKI